MGWAHEAAAVLLRLARARDLVPAGIELSNGVCEVRVLELVSSTEFIARTPKQITTPPYNALMEVLCPAN